MGQVDSDTSVWYSLHIFINLQVRDFLTQSLNANPTVKQAFLYCPWICPVYFKLLGNLSRHLIAMNVMAQLYMIWFQKKKSCLSTFVPRERVNYCFPLPLFMILTKTCASLYIPPSVIFLSTKAFTLPVHNKLFHMCMNLHLSALNFMWCFIVQSWNLSEVL